MKADVICNVQAYWCHCALTPGHDGAHECGEEQCRGSWIGDPDTSEFKVVRWPAGLNGSGLLDSLLEEWT